MKINKQLFGINEKQEELPPLHNILDKNLQE